MKSAFIALIAVFLGTQVSHAGLRFNHVIYECDVDRRVKSDVKGADVQILEAVATSKDSKADLEGQWAIYGEIEASNGRTIHIIRSADVSTGWLNWDEKNVEDSGDIIGEEPSSVSFTINTRTLKADLTYKKWEGYVRWGSPAFQIHAPLICEPVDKMVD